MGDIWLHDLPAIARRAGLDVVEAPGWRDRGRSTGGLDALVGWMWHHTASPVSWDGTRDATYIATGAPARPISQTYIPRTGVLHILAAGACNHGGRGGPVAGWLPQDRANTMVGATEMGNAGTGEPWPQVQIDASVAFAAELSLWFGFGVDRHIGHKEYCGPFSSTPGRKIDPYGPWMGGGSWGPMQGSDPLGPWRALITHRLAPIEPTPPQEADDMQRELIRASNSNAVFDTDGHTKSWAVDPQALDVKRLVYAQRGWDATVHVIDPQHIAGYGPVVGPIPAGHDEWGRKV